jgi:hypothetical protein
MQVRFQHIYVLGVVALVGWFLLGCTAFTQPATSGNDVVMAFQRAGLEVEEARPMTEQDYGTAPQVCDGMRFLIASLGPDHGGRVYFCEDSTERDSIAAFYRDRGERSPAARSWVFVKGNVVVQLNGALSEEKAQAYEAAIP